MSKKTVVVFGALTSMVIAIQSSQAQQIREVANPRMTGIAKVTRDPSGQPIVMYNPIRCAQMGPACAFFRAHEHAHIQLNHFGRRTPTIQAEREADCWAAKQVSRSTFNSAVQWFRAGNSPHVHGSGPQRAAQIMRCR